MYTPREGDRKPERKKKSETSWSNGRRVGLLTEWYENGQKKDESHFVNDKLDGLSTRWYENGKKRSETNYVKDTKDGLDTFWYQGGGRTEKIYVNGNFSSRTDWDSEGNECAQGDSGCP